MLGRRFDDGVDLSGGEWQKVALARAYMRDAQLLILDEPTAALDARAEYDVFVRFNALMAGRMALVISHRFSTVRMADRIIVLKDGEIVEQGTHDELASARRTVRRAVRDAGRGLSVAAARSASAHSRPVGLRPTRRRRPELIFSRTVFSPSSRCLASSSFALACCSASSVATASFAAAS